MFHTREKFNCVLYRHNLPVLVKAKAITCKQELAQLYYQQLIKCQQIKRCEPKVMSRLNCVYLVSFPAGIIAVALNKFTFFQWRNANMSWSPVHRRACHVMMDFNNKGRFLGRFQACHPLIS